jgi:hypothetical protein
MVYSYILMMITILTYHKNKQTKIKKCLIIIYLIIYLDIFIYYKKKYVVFFQQKLDVVKFLKLSKIINR